MVKISKEIDLRSPEFITSRRFIKPSFIKYLLVFLGLILILSAHYGAIRYCDHLHSRLYVNTAAVQKLKKEVAPLTELSHQASIKEARSGLKQSILNSFKPLHTYLTQARQLADLYHLNIDLATIDGGGILILKGTGHQINNIALYNQALEELTFIARSEITTINLVQEKMYYFEVHCLTKPAGGEKES